TAERPNTLNPRQCEISGLAGLYLFVPRATVFQQQATQAPISALSIQSKSGLSAMLGAVRKRVDVGATALGSKDSRLGLLEPVKVDVVTRTVCGAVETAVAWAVCAGVA